MLLEEVLLEEVLLEEVLTEISIPIPNPIQWTTMDNNGQQWKTMENNGQQSAVLHASLMPFL